jgi:hypothetical protein
MRLQSTTVTQALYLLGHDTVPETLTEGEMLEIVNLAFFGGEGVMTEVELPLRSDNAPV